MRETRPVCGAVAAAARARRSDELKEPLGAGEEPCERWRGARGEPSTLLERRLRTAERGPPPSHGVLERNLPPGAPTRRSEAVARPRLSHAGPERKMKLVVALCLAAPAAGFGFGKKGAKAAPKAQKRSSSGAQYPSVALPWTTTPLDGSLVGDVGFDPLGFSKYAPGAWWVGDEGDGSLKIFREAELMHGRIAQLACLGWVFPEIAHWPGKDGAFGKMNPFDALDAIPKAGWYQILGFMVACEVWRINKLKDPSYMPGDSGLGQGPGRWNPFGFNYTPEEYREKQLQEIKHCRLAMLGIVGLAAKSSGAGDVGVLQQVGESFSSPEYTSLAGFYFPEGI